MLRTTVLSLIALSCLTAAARQLTPDEALSRLQASEASRIKAASPQAQPKLVATGHTAAGDAAYYVFAAGSRTIFASADDVAAPLLGYTDNAPADMDQMPPAMRWWLDQYAREIAWANANGAATYTALTYADGDMAAIEPLIQTTWDQGSPYNDLCPLKNGSRTYSGCVATAMAQAMNYHRWPAVGTGAVSYEWNGETLSMDLSTAPLAWDDMLDTYTAENPGSETQRQAVATLMKACGYSVEMNYGLAEDGGSGAYTFNLPVALVDHFGYDAAARLEYRDFYPLDEWERMMHDNLANVGPILYGGLGSKGGHSFICDGYSSDGYFHINWGWSGISDGYFLLSALDPYTLGAGGGDGGFNSDQDAVLGVQKPQAGSVKPAPYIGCQTGIVASAEERTVTIQPMQNMPPYLFCNLGTWPGTFTLGFMLASDDDSEAEPIYITSENVVDHELASHYGVYYIKGEIPSTVANGDYKAYPTYRLGDGEWEQIRVVYGKREYIALTVSDDEVTISPDSAAPGLYLTGYDCPPTLTCGEPYSIEVTLLSTYTSDREIEIEADLIEAESGFWVDAFGTYNATIKAGEEKTVKLEGTLADDTAPGVYSILLSENMAGEIGIIPGIQVLDASGLDDISGDAAAGSDTRWYDLTGSPVGHEPQTPGIYIKVSGGKAEKVMVK